MPAKKCDVHGCLNRDCTSTDLLFFTLPAGRREHSKWLNKTFGDIGVNNPDCQTVCEIHADPEFVRIVRARSGYKYKSKTSGPSPGPSVESKHDEPKKKRKRGRPATAKLGTKKRKRNSKQVEERFKFVSIPEVEDPDLVNEEDMTEPKEVVSTIANKKMLKQKTLKVVPRPKGLKKYVSKKPTADTTNLATAQQLYDVITSEVMIKEDPDAAEEEILPSIIPVNFKIKVETSDLEENMNEDLDNQSFVASEPLTYHKDNDFNVPLDIKSEDRTFSIEDVNELRKEIKIESQKEDLEDQIDEASKIDPSLLYQVKKQVGIATNPEHLKDIHSVDELLKDLVDRKFITTIEMNVLAALNLESRLLKEEVPCTSTLHSKLRAFAITLYVYSHEAYEYIRTHYKTTLPIKNTVREWLVKPSGHLGFTRETLIVISTKVAQSNSPLLVCLDIKEIKLRPVFCTNGALVFTAVAINANWKLPIGYFWTNVVKDRANLVQIAISLLEKVGAEPVAVSFDYNDDNLQMCKQLSSSIICFNKHLTSVFVSESGKETFLFPDPRGILERMYRDANNINNIVDDNHQAVFLDRNLLQKKLTDVTAQQLLRKVVASELFKNDCTEFATESTIKFFKNLHVVLDVLSCRIDGRNFEKTILNAGNYFKSLQIKDPTMENCILGLCALIDSALLFISKYNSLRFEFGKFVESTYFLANMTPLGQNRRNPTTHAFQREYKATLRHTSNRSQKIILDNDQSIPLLKCKSPIDRINITTYLSNGNSTINVVDDLKILFGYKFTEYEDMIVVYVARFVTYSLTRRLACAICIRALQCSENIAKPEVVTRFAVKLEDFSPDVLDICKRSEAVFKNLCYRSNAIPEFCVPFLVMKVMKEYIDRPLFEGLLHHQFNTDGTCNHIVELAKAVAELYLETRIKYHKQYEYHTNLHKLIDV